MGSNFAPSLKLELSREEEIIDLKEEVKRLNHNLTVRELQFEFLLTFYDKYKKVVGYENNSNKTD